MKFPLLVLTGAYIRESIQLSLVCRYFSFSKKKKKPFEILFSLLGETSHKVLSSSFRRIVPRSTTYKDEKFLRLDLSLICSIEFLYNTLSVLFLSISTYSRNLVLLFLSISVYSRNIVTSLKQTISGEKKKLATSKVGSPEKKKTHKK